MRVGESECMGACEYMSVRGCVCERERERIREGTPYCDPIISLFCGITSRNERIKINTVFKNQSS